MTPGQLFVLAVAPGFVLLVGGAAAQIISAARGRSVRTGYRVMALGCGLAPLGAAVGLLVAAQPLWVKAIAVPPLVLVSLPFLDRAWRPPATVS